MRIHVVGLGAVGSFVAFHLRRTLGPKHSVFGLHRRQSAPAFSQNLNGQSILLDIDGVTHSQDGVAHLTYSQPFEQHGELPTEQLRSAQGPEPDYPLLLSRPYDAHQMRRVHGHLDSLIVTTKAYAVAPVIGALRGLISSDTTIVLLHNGMGTYERVIKDYFPDPYDRPNFVLATNTHGLWRKDIMHVVQSGVGEIQLGIVPDPFGHDFEASLKSVARPSFAELSLDDIADVKDEKGIQPRHLSLRNTIAALTGARALAATWRPYHQVQTAMRQKLVVNAFVNPVSALLQCKNGEVLKTGHGHWVMHRICEEAEAAFKAELKAQIARQQTAYEQAHGVRPPPTAFDAQFPRALTKLALRAEIERVVEQTKNNYSSMYLDLKLGHTTEAKFINGHLLRLAKENYTNNFVNEALYNLVKMRCAIPLVSKPSV